MLTLLAQPTRSVRRTSGFVQVAKGLRILWATDSSTLRLLASNHRLFVQMIPCREELLRQSHCDSRTLSFLDDGHKPRWEIYKRGSGTMEAERPCYSATDGLDDSSVALHVQDRTIWLEAVLRLECHLS